MPSATQIATHSILSPRSVDAPRPLKVICIGAGCSGLVAGIRLPEKVKDLDLVIYDKNEEVGGTWFENKYPGCACDIPAHVYQLSFEANPGWSTFYAKAPEILEYFKRITDKYGLRKHIKLGHKVLEARWNTETSRWHVRLQIVKTGEIFEDTADALFTGTGVLNEWKWPEIPGLHDFKGKLLHSAVWDTSFDHKGKRIAVIGAGSSGIQILPNIQPHVSRVDHYVRGKTWIATTIASDEVKKRNDTAENFEYTAEEIKDWKENPQLYLAYRKKLETELQSGNIITVRGSEAQKMAKADFIKLMRDRLAKKPEVADHMLPDFPPLCKRLTPGPGYLEALTEDNVDVIPTAIETITETGVRTTDGKHREVDAIICATGFDTSFRNRFPIYGESGIKLGDKWADRAETYLSIMTDDFPNLFMSLGPNSGTGTGNLLVMIERYTEYAAKCLSKLQTENILTMQPKRRATKNFTDYCDAYFKGTVYSEECSSWYKTGGKNGRVAALWPGSSLHAVQTLANPRWEDFEYTYVDGNEFGWIGDGWCVADRTEGADRSWYLDEQRMVHEPLEERKGENGFVGGAAREGLKRRAEGVAGE
ncbi:hypothetical protein MMC25_003196 [Agyrium rufum]|nr:hypothetical protein [Agyrium rufum]